MPVIKAQQIPKKAESAEDTLARFCFYFQQYTYSEARQLPFVRVFKMLKVATRERARQMYELTQVVSAPHNDKGNGVQKMLNYFYNLMEE